MADLDPQSRSYRFNPRDRSGWIMGFQPAQCIAIATSVILFVMLFRGGLPMPLPVLPVLIAVVFSFGMFKGRRLYEWVPIVSDFGKNASTGGGRWFSALPMVPARRNAETQAAVPPLPPVLAGIEILELECSWARRGMQEGVAVVYDKTGYSLSASVPVSGREFALVDRTEQIRMIDGWGDALGVFSREFSPLARISWSEWAAPSGVDDHRFYLEEERKAADDSPALEAYLDLLDIAGPMVTNHEVLVTLTIDINKVRPSRRTNENSEDSARKVILEELRLLTQRLEGANLNVGEPLSPSELGRSLRVRMDPGESLRLSSRRRFVGSDAELISSYNFAPTAVVSAWDHVRVDGAFHKAFWVSEWPRLDVPPDWMAAVLLNPAGVRSLVMVYEPVPPSKSQKRVDRESTKLVTDEEQREKHGFRVGAQHRRLQQAVLEREQELVAGFSEFEFTGLVIVSAPDLQTLDDNCSEYEQIAAQCGLGLTALDGRHDVGWVASLPIGRNIAGRMIRS